MEAGLGAARAMQLMHGTTITARRSFVLPKFR
jgi:hypothetical protein